MFKLEVIIIIVFSLFIYVVDDHEDNHENSEEIKIALQIYCVDKIECNAGIDGFKIYNR